MDTTDFATLFFLYVMNHLVSPTDSAQWLGHLVELKNITVSLRLQDMHRPHIPAAIWGTDFSHHRYALAKKGWLHFFSRKKC